MHWLENAFGRSKGMFYTLSLWSGSPSPGSETLKSLLWKALYTGRTCNELCSHWFSSGLEGHTPNLILSTTTVFELMEMEHCMQEEIGFLRAIDLLGTEPNMCKHGGAMDSTVKVLGSNLPAKFCVDFKSVSQLCADFLRIRWGWLGCTLRKNATTMTNQVLKCNPQGKRKWGWPRNT